MATAVQLSSGVHLTYFQPTVDQYLKKVEQAIASGDLESAKQALAQLKKAVSGADKAGDGSGHPTGHSGANMQDVNAALGSGDLAWAERAVNDLRQTLSMADPRQTTGESGGDAASSGAQGDSSETDGSGDGSRGLDVKA